MEVALIGGWILHAEESVILSDLSLDTMVSAHPVKRALDLAVGTRHTALAVGIIRALDLDDVAVSVFLASGAHHDVGILQSHLFARCHAEELLRCLLHEVSTLDPQVAGEGDGVCAGLLVLGIVDSLHLLALSFGIVGDDQLHGIEDGRDTCGTLVEILTNGSLQESHVVERVELGVADRLDEVLDRLRRIATTTHATESRHTGIVPAVDEMLIDKGVELTLRHHGIGEVEPVELDLPRAEVVESLGCCAVVLFEEIDELVVEWAMGYKLQRTDGVGDTLEIVALSVSEVIHRIAVPLGTGAVMWNLNDTVHDRITEVHVGVSHVELGSEHHRSLDGLGGIHLLEQT